MFGATEMCKSVFAIVFSVLTFGPLTMRGQVTGTWKGFYEAPTGLGAIELTVNREASDWKAVCKFPEIDGENTFPILDLKVSDTELSFVVMVESRQMRFRGKPTGDNIEGTYEMFRDGKSSYVGDWRVKRTPAAGPTVARGVVGPSGSPPTFPEQTKRLAELPFPTGPFAIGRTTFYWVDSARPEILTAAPNDKRELMVTLWYPAQELEDVPPAAYFPHYELIAGASARLPSSRQAHAFEKAPLARVAQRFPVILFSHGLGENTVRYSAQLEELASYGFVVVAIDHSYANQGVVFPDGRVVRFNNRWEWAFSSNGPDQERFIRSQLRVMVEDVSFVVDQLNKLNDSPSEMFRGKLDLSRLGFFGHSLGGAIALLVCQRDRRFKACLNQDGSPTGQVLILDPPDGKLERPFMFFRHNDRVTEETLQLMALTRAEYENRNRVWQRHAYHLLDTMPTESYVVSIGGAEHASFTDNPALAANTVSAYRSRARTLQVIREYTRAFFSRYLLNEDSRLLDGTSSQYPEVTIDRFGARSTRRNTIH